MTTRDRQCIYNLYSIHRFPPASIARLYGLSHQRMLVILEENKDITIISDTNCLLCGLDDAETFYNDGNRENKKPKNLIALCDADKRRIQHMQLRRRKGIVTPQMD